LGYVGRIYGSRSDFKGRACSAGAAFWMNLPTRYDLAMAEKRLGAKFRAEVEAA
jgi:plasmid maintenance system antidote protein VapI